MIHLIVAEDEFLAAELTDRLAAPDAEVVTIDAETSDVPGLTEALVAQSLFSSKRVVVVRGAEKLGSGGLKKLAAALETPSGTDVIVVAVSDRPPSSLQKALQGIAKSHRAARPKRGELVAWVVARMKGAGVQTGREAAGLLVEAIGGSLRDLAQAVDQLALRRGRGGVVEQEDVLALFPGLAEQPSWAMYDALVARDGRRAYRVLHALLTQGNDPIGVLFAIVSSNRHVMRAKAALERTPGISDNQLASALAVSPGRAGVLKRQASHLSWPWLVKLHTDAAEADFDLKGGDEIRIVGVLPPEIVLERLIDRALPATDVIPG